MTDLNPTSALRGHPHKVGWFYDLTKLFKLDSLPVAQGFDDGPDEGSPKPDDALAELLRLSTDRKKRNQIFEEMDAFGLVQAILDVYSEESTQPDYDKARRVWVESKAAHMIGAADDMFHNVQMEERVTPVARRMCKYGDAFQRLIYATGKGVLGWRAERASEVARIEDRYSRLIGFKQTGKKYRQRSRDVSWPWDYVHFRLLGKDEQDLYGTSLLEALYRSWRQMMLTEDSMLMFRLRRAPDRNMIFVDVGNMEPHEALAYTNKWRKRFRKHEYVDPASPNYRKQYNPLTPLEDIFVPWREGQNTRVETLSGSGSIGEIYDLEHFRDAFFGSAKTPKAYFGFEGDVNAKATLAQQDVRFARTIKRVRHATIQGIRNALDIHYTLLRTPEVGSKFDFTNKENAYLVHMSPISFLDEFERLELVQLRYQIVQALAQVAGDMQIDARVWAIYVLLTFGKLPEDMVLRLIKKVPDQVDPPEAADNFDRVDRDRVEQIVDPNGKQGLGAWSLTEAEKTLCDEIVHRSPGLRRSIANLAEMALDEWDQQVDPSLLPPRVSGVPLVDDTFAEHEAAARELREDLDSLGASRQSEQDASEVLTESGSG